MTGPGSTTLSYDPLMRLRRVVSGATTNMVYDGLDRIAEYSSSVVQRRYVHGPGVDEPIVWYEGSGTSDRRFLSSDERGSIISVTNSAGTLLGINRYDEFGQPQSTNLGVFGYTGQAWVPSIGVWYYKARVYDADMGRFLQPDPIGFEGGPNLYAYVTNDPVNLLDPLGLSDEDTAYCDAHPDACVWVIGRLPNASPSAGRYNQRGPGSAPLPPGGSAPGTTGESSDDSTQPTYCSNPSWKRGQNIKDTGLSIQLTGISMAAFGVGEALYFGTMTAGPGASAAAPTFVVAGTLYGVGSGVSAVGSVQQGLAGDPNGWREAVTWGATSILGGVSGVTGGAQIVADMIMSPVTVTANPCR